jgi:hypothetical protein
MKQRLATAGLKQADQNPAPNARGVTADGRYLEN